MAKPSKEGVIAGIVAVGTVAVMGGAVVAQREHDAKKNAPSPSPSASAKR